MPLKNQDVNRLPIAAWLGAIAILLYLFSRYVYGAVVATTWAVVCYPSYRSWAAALARLPLLRASRQSCRTLAALFCELAAVVLLALCLGVPTWVLVRNDQVIAEQGRRVYDEVRGWAQKKMQSAGRRLHIEEWSDLQATLPPPPQQPQTGVSGLVNNPAPLLLFSIRTAGSLVEAMVQVLIMLLVMHAMLLYGPQLWTHFLERSPDPWRSTLPILGSHAKKVLMATYMVHGLTAFAAFLLALPVFWVIIGPRYFFLMAVVAGFFQLIPLLGSSLLVAALTIYFFSTGDARAGWLCVGLGFPVVVGLPDLGIRPLLARRTGKISSLTMLVGFLAGLEIFGISGFVLGPLCLALGVRFTRLMLYGREEELPEG